MTTEQVVRIALDWVPFLIFVGLMIYFMRKVAGGSRYQEAMRIYAVEHLAETKRLNQNLERIAAALEKQGN